MLFGLILFFYLKYVILQLGVDGNQISCKNINGKYLLKITLMIEGTTRFAISQQIFQVHMTQMKVDQCV